MSSVTTIDWTEFSLQVIISFTHFLWLACVVAVLMAVIQHGFMRHKDGRVSNAHLRYMTTSLAFFSLPICLLATFICVHHLRGSFVFADDGPATSVANATVVDSATMPTPRIDGSLSRPSALPPASPVVADLSDMVTIKPRNTTTFDRTWSERGQTLAPYVVIAYIIGVAFMLMRLGSSIASSSRLRRMAQPITDTDWLAIVAEQSSRLGLRRLPVVALCPRVTVPMVVGIIKPMVLVPPALMCSMEPSQLAAILSHELAHLRRYDLLINLLQRIVEALLFFHPVTWWISRRVRIERENCCDDMAAAGCGRLEYASALLQMAEQCAALRGWKLSPQLESLAADGGNTSQLGYRIGRLLDRDDAPRIALTRSAVSALAFVTALTVAMVALAQTASDDPADQPRAENAATPKTETPAATPERPAKKPVLPPPRFVVPDVESPGEAQAKVTVRHYDAAAALDKILQANKGDEEFDKETAAYLLNMALESANVGSDEKSQIIVTGDQVVVRASEETHQKIAAELKRITEFGCQRQITIDTRICDLPQTLFEQLKLDWKTVQEGPAQQNQQPMIMTVMNAGQRDVAIDLAQQSPRANIKMLPKVRTFNGRSVACEDLVERPFVTGYEEKGDGNNGQDNRKAIIRKLREGLQLSIRPVNRSGSIELNLELTLSKIDSIVFSNASDDARVQLPAVRQAHVNTSISLPEGQSLAVAMPSLDNSERVFLCLITPQVIDGDSAKTPKQEQPAAEATPPNASKAIPWMRERYTRIPIPGPITKEGPPIALEPPSDDEVIRAFIKTWPDATIVPLLNDKHHSNVRIIKEKIADYVDPPGVVPEIGRAQLHHAHYKCTFSFDKPPSQASQTQPANDDESETVGVLYVDHHHYHLVPTQTTHQPTNTPLSAARAAWNASDRNLSVCEGRGVWSSQSNGLKLSGTFQIKNAAEKFYLKMECEESSARSTATVRVPQPGDKIILLDDGKTLASNTIGPIASPRKCLIRVFPRSQKNVIHEMRFISIGMSSVSHLVNPPALQDSLGVVQRTEEGFYADSKLGDLYVRRVYFSETSGFNMQAWEFLNQRTGEIDFRADVEWVSKGGAWYPKSFRSRSRASKDEPNTKSLVFESLVTDQPEKEEDFRPTLLEPCDGATLVDKRVPGSTRILKVENSSSWESLADLIGQ